MFIFAALATRLAPDLTVLVPASDLLDSEGVDAGGHCEEFSED